jgi:hypothetical protein
MVFVSVGRFESGNRQTVLFSRQSQAYQVMALGGSGLQDQDDNAVVSGRVPFRQMEIITDYQ